MPEKYKYTGCCKKYEVLEKQAESAGGWCGDSKTAWKYCHWAEKGSQFQKEKKSESEKLN